MHKQAVPRPARQRILEAAETLFAQHGYKATSVQSIVDRARINKRMLYHYFGSKRGLYNAVLQESVPEIFDRSVGIGSYKLGDHEPPVALAFAVKEYFDALLTHSRYVRLILWEEADGWSVLNDSPRHALDRLRELFIAIIQQGIGEGTFDSNLNPDMVWFYIIGIPNFYFGYRPRLQIYSEQDLTDLDIVQSFRRNIIRFVLLGLGTSREMADEVVAFVCSEDQLIARQQEADTSAINSACYSCSELPSL